MVDRFVYPEYVSLRSGIKVSWYYYKTEDEAKEAAKVAVREGQYYAGQGYDFGYCSPGSIYKTKEGLYEVCIP